MEQEPEMRFEFGKNWHQFIKRNFSEERLAVASKKILDFTGRTDFADMELLDIGCGSGIHSYAIHKAGAKRLHSFDFDPNSVLATTALHKMAGEPDSWKIERGDVLDDNYMAGLGKFEFVYSWGVLHHTGEMWRAIENAQKTVANDGWFYIALYSTDAAGNTMDYWLEKKQEYNRSSDFKKRYMAWWYVWKFGIQKNPMKIPGLLKQIWAYRTKRGMDYFTDVHDWLGGWPMEYAGDQETVDFLEQKFGFRLVNVTTGHACSEFLFQRTGTPETPTKAGDLVTPF